MCPVMFLSQLELAEKRIDHIGAVRRDGIAVEGEGFVEFVFVVNGADIDDNVLLVVFFDLFVGGFLCPEADFVEDCAVEIFIDGAFQIAGGEALDEDGGIPFLQQLQLARMEGQDQTVGEDVLLLTDFIDLARAVVVVLFQFDKYVVIRIFGENGVQRLLERRNLRPHEFRIFPSTEIELADVVEEEIMDIACSVGATFDGVVMGDDELAVFRGMDVEFERIESVVHGGDKGGDGVFGILRTEAAMADDHEVFQHGERLF